MRTTHLFSLVICSSLAAIGACSPYDPDLGTQPFLCDAVEPRCPEGYGCELDTGSQMMVCISKGGIFVDSGPTGFLCADDNALEKPEKNDTIQTAYQTPVAASRMDIAFGSAICPEGDKDNYAVYITTTGQNLELTVSWESGLPLSAAILNSGGTSIANATSNGANSIKAFAANLPANVYFGQAFGGATTKNNYRVAIKVTGP